MTDSEGAVANPPAFPNILPGSMLEHPGMSLRDWFAGQALAVVYPLPTDDTPRSAESWEIWAGYAAKRAYTFADAMLAARSGDTP